MSEIINKLAKPTSKTLILIIGGLLIIALLIWGISWIAQPNQVPLTGKTDEKNSAEIIALLTQWGESFSVDSSTGQVLVEESRVAAVRAKLINEGGLSQQPMGFDLFVQGDYGVSDFAQRVNYQRALEGELAKTIRAMTEVRGVRVHITLAKGSMFEDRKEIAKASVFLQLKPEKTLSESQIIGMRRLVSSAVPGLKDENVAIVDESGTALSAGDATSFSKNQWEWTQRYESEYEMKARNLMASLLNDEQFHVSVRVKANFDKVRSVREQIIPANSSGAGYLNKKRESVANGNTASSTVVSGSQNNSQQESEYIFGKEQSEIERAAGQIERVSIGVVLTTEVAENTKQELQKVLESGLGLQTTRGDQLTMVVLPALAPVEATKANATADGKNISSDSATTSTVKHPFNYTLSHVTVVALIVLCIGLFLGFAINRGNKSTKIADLSEAEKQQLIEQTRRWLNQVDA